VVEPTAATVDFRFEDCKLMNESGCNLFLPTRPIAVRLIEVSMTNEQG